MWGKIFGLLLITVFAVYTGIFLFGVETNVKCFAPDDTGYYVDVSKKFNDTFIVLFTAQVGLLIFSIFQLEKSELSDSTKELIYYLWIASFLLLFSGLVLSFNYRMASYGETCSKSQLVERGWFLYVICSVILGILGIAILLCICDACCKKEPVYALVRID